MKRKTKKQFGENGYELVMLALFIAIVIPIFLTKIIYPNRIPYRYVKENSIDAYSIIVSLQSIGVFDGKKLSYDIDTYIVYEDIDKQYIDIYGNLCRYDMNTETIRDVISDDIIYEKLEE